MNSIKDIRPLVSVIIPVYNVEMYITECLHSVISQTYSHMEIILVDDQGNDRSTKIARSILADSSVVWKIVEHEINQGLSAARNTGVFYAQGKYIYFMDSDDVIPPRSLETLVSQAEEQMADMTYGNYLELRNGVLTKGYRTRSHDAFVSTDPWYALVHNQFSPFACNRLILREWYLSTGVNFIEGMLHEDDAWTLSLVSCYSRVAYVNDITYHYRVRPNSITNTNNLSEQKINSDLKILELSRKNANICPKKYLRDYAILHNGKIANALWRIWGANLPKMQEQIHSVLKLLWIPNISTSFKISLLELRWVYFFRCFMPVDVAFRVSCKFVSLYFRIVS